MKKKTLIITLASVAAVVLLTTGLLIYGAFQGVAYLIKQAGPQVSSLQAQDLQSQVVGIWGQLQKTIHTPECRTAFSQVTNLQVWLLGGGESLVPQIGLSCLGSYFKLQPTQDPEPSESEEVNNEII